MKPSLSPEYLNHIWSKSPRREGLDSETLVKHTWYTLEFFVRLNKERPFLDTLIGYENFWKCLFWAFYFHDMGKAHPGFQESLRLERPWVHRHEVFSLPFCNWISSNFSENDKLWIMSTIIFHHKEPKEIFSIYNTLDDDLHEDLNNTINQFEENTILLIWQWINEYLLLWLEELGLKRIIEPFKLVSQKEALNVFYKKGSEIIVNNLKMVRKFIWKLKNENTHCKLMSIAFRGLMNVADYSASAHIEKFPKLTLISLEDFFNNSQLNNKYGLYCHQRKSLHTVGSSILIAPTGTGKTESSLLWALSQKNQFGTFSRLFYMLPYQASMNAMYDRLVGYGFGGVGLEHGRSVLALYKRMFDEKNHQKTRNARWLKQLARLNYYPVKVLSPYQLMKALFRLKTYELMLVDYFNSLIIIDEIHVYEPEKMALILGLINYLRRNFNARFFIMSATMPSFLIKWLKKCAGNFSIIRASTELYNKYCRHQLFLIEKEITDESVSKQIVDEAIEGKNVLVCCNRVSQSQKVYSQLFELLKKRCNINVELLLIHGRFNGRDRLLIEKRIHNLMGTNSKRKKTIVLVATQVIEVSMDIDFDILFSELAPLEALIQRFGRINRKNNLGLAPVKVLTIPADGQNVYDDLLINKTKVILETINGKKIQEQEVNNLLDCLYSENILGEWEERFSLVYENFIGGSMISLFGFNTNDDAAGEFYKQFDSMDVLPFVLKKQYEELLNKSPLLASELLVPVKPALILSKSTGEQINNVPIIKADYNEMGLILS